MSTPLKNTRRRSDEMYPLVELYLEGSLTQKEFCDEMEISRHVFNYWLMKFRREKQGTDAGEHGVGFVALDVKEGLPLAQKRERLVQISYPDGTVVELSI